MKLLSCLALPLVLSAGAAFACEPVTMGDITVEAPWSRVSLGTQRPGVVYLTIRNDGETDDALIGITTPVAGMPMIHETVDTDGVVSMPHVMEVPVAAGETVALEPGGYHAMLMDLTEALEEGGSFPVTLTFEQAGEITVDVQVRSITARESGC